MKYLDAVSSEGGPLLLADAATARAWRGVEEDSADYELACQILERGHADPPGGLIPIGQNQGVVWDLGGPGTADIFLDAPGRLMLVRVWMNKEDDENVVFALAALPLNAPVSFASLEINSGVLAILWAPESGECIESLDITGSQPPTGEMSIDSAGLLVSLPNGHYFCLHDEVELDTGQEARRCHLIKQ